MGAPVKARCSAGLNNIRTGYKWKMGPKYQWNRASPLLSIVRLLVGRVGRSINQARNRHGCKEFPRQPVTGLTREEVRNVASATRSSRLRMRRLYSGVVSVQIRKRLTLSSTAASFAVLLLTLSTASPN